MFESLVREGPGQARQRPGCGRPRGTSEGPRTPACEPASSAPNVYCPGLEIPDRTRGEREAAGGGQGSGLRVLGGGRAPSPCGPFPGDRLMFAEPAGAPVGGDRGRLAHTQAPGPHARAWGVPYWRKVRMMLVSYNSDFFSDPLICSVAEMSSQTARGWCWLHSSGRLRRARHQEPTVPSVLKLALGDTPSML